MSLNKIWAEQVQGVPAPPSHPAPAQEGHQVPQQQDYHASPAQQRQQIVPFNWSHFKPELSGKFDEDAEAHYSTLMAK